MSLEEILKSGNYQLIDVREPMELEMDGYIEGAENIPLGEVEERKEEILAIDKPVVLFCRSGNRRLWLWLCCCCHYLRLSLLVCFPH